MKNLKPILAVVFLPMVGCYPYMAAQVRSSAQTPFEKGMAEVAVCLCALLLVSLVIFLVCKWGKKG